MTVEMHIQTLQFNWRSIFVMQTATPPLYSLLPPACMESLAMMISAESLDPGAGQKVDRHSGTIAPSTASPALHDLARL